MIVDYSFNTGTTVDLSDFNIKGDQYRGIISIDATGTHTILASLNSQTLLETTPVIFPVGFDIRVENSGDFYLTGVSVALTDLTGLSSYRFIYDNSQTGVQTKYYTGVSGALQTGFMDVLDSGTSLPNFEPQVFLNGQKVYSGISFSRSADTHSWTDDLADSGKMFYQTKGEGIYESFATGVYDLSGQRFNFGTATLYLNGMEQDSDSFLELGGVTPIDTGKAFPLPYWPNWSKQKYSF